MSVSFDILKESKYELESRVSLSAKMHSTLSQYFGYTSFRPLQEEIILDVLAKKDVFVLMPTGGGKSICYQLPALLIEGVTVVVSPLISLMKDQVDSLEANGIVAACLNSTQNARETRDVKAAFLANKLKILYVAPERLMMPGTFSFLKKGKISLFAIDEAHCISEWGHDFRPEYRKLKLLRDPKTGFPDVPIIALTATATERVREDIISQLNLAISPEKGPYIASFNRSNLYYEVRPKKETFSEITDYLRKHRGEAGIIYCQSRNSVEALAKKLNVAGFRALPYHAGLSDRERTRNQDLFIKDDVEIIVATIAFGMGIDKSNVRFVIHYDLPKNLESYYQETGRGGRDGSPCECILFFSRGDRFKIDYFISQKTNEKEKDISLLQLRQMVAYCEGNKCRRQTLMEYFGETLSGACGNCDSCLRPKNTFDGTEAAKKLIACVQELNQRFGINYVIDVLTGSKNKKIKQNRHERLKSHGSGREFTKEQWRSLASEITNTGFLEVSGGQYPVLKLNSLSRKILNGTEQIELICPEGFMPETEEYLTPTGVSVSKWEMGKNKLETTVDAPEEDLSVKFSTAEEVLKKKAVVEETSFTPVAPRSSITGNFAKLRKEPDPILFERLKALRKELALKKNLPPYIIFSDTTLKEMATKFPRTSDEFHAITGVGDHKLRKYGDVFIAEIEHYCKDYDLTGSTSSENSITAELKNELIGNEFKPDVEREVTEKTEEFEVKNSAIDSNHLNDLQTEKIVNLEETSKLSKKRTRYLDTSIQAWSEADSLIDSSVLNIDEDNSKEMGLVANIPGQEISYLKNPVKSEPCESNSTVDQIEKRNFENNSINIEKEALQRTYSLFVQGLGIDEIAEIQGVGTGFIFRQFEQLILEGKVQNIEGLLPKEKEQEIRAALESLMPELDSFIKTRMGEDCQEEELNFVRALLFSKLRSSKF